MTLSSKLFNAILSMDAYNRGYDASIILSGTQIANANIIKDSSVLLDDSEQRRDDDIGFYALAYDTDGDGEADIIAYRGTDYPADGQTTNGIPNDIYYGWTLGGGITDSSQGKMAVEFYKEVVGEENVLSAENISLVGHSLGGGLAGYIASLYHKEAAVYDTMTFALAAQKTYEKALEYQGLIDQGYTYQVTLTSQLDDNSVVSVEYVTESEMQDYLDNPPDNTDVSAIPISELLGFESSVYNGIQIQEPNDDLVDGYYMSQEILDIFLSARDGSAEDGGQYYLGEDGEYYNLVDTSPYYQGIYTAIMTVVGGSAGAIFSISGITVDEALEAIALHSVSSLVIRMYADEAEQAGNTSWKIAARYFWPVMYDTDFAAEIGFSDETNDDIKGELLENHGYADIMRMLIAYSAIDGGEDVVRLFGDTGIRSLYHDANDLGYCLSASGATETVEAYATEISKVFVQFSGELALSKILKSEMPEALTGVLEHDGNMLIVDFSDELWTAAGRGTKPDMVGRALLVEKFFDYTVLADSELQGAMSALWGDNSDSIIDRVVFGINENIDIVIPDKDLVTSKVTLFIGGDSSNTVTVATGNNLLYGGSGNDDLHAGSVNDIINGALGDDKLFGAAGNDYVYGSLGDDEIYGGEGDDRLFGDSGNDELFGDSGNDVLDGGLVYEDTANYENDPEGIEVDYTAGTVKDGWGYTDTLISIEKIIATDYDDRFSISNLEISTDPEIPGVLKIDGKDGTDTLDLSGVSCGIGITGSEIDGTKIEFENIDHIIGTSESDTFYKLPENMIITTGDGADVVELSRNSYVTDASSEDRITTFGDVILTGASKNAASESAWAFGNTGEKYSVNTEGDLVVTTPWLRDESGNELYTYVANDNEIVASNLVRCVA